MSVARIYLFILRQATEFPPVRHSHADQPQRDVLMENCAARHETLYAYRLDKSGATMNANPTNGHHYLIQRKMTAIPRLRLECIVLRARPALLRRRH